MAAPCTPAVTQLPLYPPNLSASGQCIVQAKQEVIAAVSRATYIHQMSLISEGRAHR